MTKMTKTITLLIVTIILIGTFVAVESRFTPTASKKRNEYYREQLLGEAPVFSNETYWFNQLQDHFDPENTQTWNQRYQVYDDEFDGTGPIFVFLAGEADMSFFTFQEVQIVNWVKEFQALYIVIEHRFYGQSYPTSDVSTENLQYLTSQQALADAANVITTYQSENGYTDNKVVVFGCSYSGALSAWFRVKYPDIAVASVAPSGPVLAQTNYTGYYEQFQNSAAPDCVNAARSASEEITQLIATQNGRSILQSTFNSCTDLEDPRDLYYFIYSIVDALGGSDQMNNPPTWILNSTCSMLTQSNDYVSNWAEIFNLGQGNTSCNDFTMASFISSMQEIEISQQNSGRTWTWQTCVEFGYFSTTYPGSSVFPGILNVEEQILWCSEIYGIDNMTPNVTYTNEYYGGKDIQGNNIAFTNGLLDPWHLLSVTENNADNSVLGITYEAGHCGSLIQETDEDPISLTNAREQVVAFLKSVLSS